MYRPLGAAIVLMLGLNPATADAQQFLGRLGSSCVQLPSTLQQFVPLTTAAPAGSTLVVTVATSSRFLSGLEIDDPLGSRYQALGGTRSNSGAVLHFRANLQRALAAGQTLMLSFENADTTVSSCVSVLAYRGIPFGNVVQESIGSANGQSFQPSVASTTPLPAARTLVLAGVAMNGSPGDVLPTAPATALPTLCASSGTLCLVEAQYFSSTSGVGQISMVQNDSRAWAAALTALQADGIFGNGFD